MIFNYRSNVTSSTLGCIFPVAGEAVEKADEELETQFLQGVEMKFKHKRHTGLGFIEEPLPPPPDSSTSEGQKSPADNYDSAAEVIRNTLAVI